MAEAPPRSPAADPPPSRLAVALATVAGNLQILLSTFVLGIPGTLVGYLPPRGAWTFVLMKFWSSTILSASGCPVEATYEAPLDRGGRHVFLANHQSLYDIPGLIVSLPQQTRFAAKRSLFRLPVFGWALATSGFIPVDRERGGKAREVLATAARRLGQASILFFPEGTRSLDGAIGPFHRGGFLLAMKNDLPVVPVGISGTFAIRRKGSFRIEPHPIRLRYGAPIDTRGYEIRDLPRLVEEVRREVARLSGLPLREGLTGEVAPEAGTAPQAGPAAGPGPGDNIPPHD